MVCSCADFRFRCQRQLDTGSKAYPYSSSSLRTGCKHTHAVVLFRIHRSGKNRTYSTDMELEHSLFADLLSWTQPWSLRNRALPKKRLLARQRDGILPKFPIWDDVCTLDGKPWRGSVDLLCGGFPCQDISAAGKGAGITGERSGLWKEYARLIGEMRPRFVFAENSPLLRTRGLGVVLEDLAALGYNARWGVLGARDVGAPHKRDRMWVLAYAMHQRLQGDQCARGLDSQGRQESDGSTSECGSLWWHTDPAESPTEPIVGRVAHGVAHRVDRLKAIGNGQVSQCATMAFSILSEGLI
jgi:DNA (cytosine-5)-methyltransferase 1